MLRPKQAEAHLTRDRVSNGTDSYFQGSLFHGNNDIDPVSNNINNEGSKTFSQIEDNVIVLRLSMSLRLCAIFSTKSRPTMFR
jgi:hypothetical protein